MEAEQEIVLQKKMIIVFALVILSIIMILLNMQKEAIQIASVSEENLSGEGITKIYSLYTANEEFFTISEDNEIKKIEENFAEKSLQAEEKSVEKSKEVKVENKEFISEEAVLEEKVDESIVQDKEKENVSSRGSYIRDTSTPPTEYRDVIQVKATAYCLCKKCCGKTPDNPRYGCTASGLKIVPGTGMKVIAVDTSIVPLGTNVYVEGLNGAGNYGYAVAADTGSAIKNYKIDLYMDTHQQALAWGVKNVNLYILDN